MPLIETTSPVNNLPEIYLTLAGFIPGMFAMWWYRDQGPSPDEVDALADEEAELAEQLARVKMQRFQAEAACADHQQCRQRSPWPRQRLCCSQASPPLDAARSDCY